MRQFLLFALLVSGCSTTNSTPASDASNDLALDSDTNADADTGSDAALDSNVPSDADAKGDSRLRADVSEDVRSDGISDVTSDADTFRDGSAETLFCCPLGESDGACTYVGGSPSMPGTHWCTQICDGPVAGILPGVIACYDANGCPMSWAAHECVRFVDAGPEGGD